MPDDHGKITREEFIRLTGEEPQQPTDADVRALREELARIEADDTLRSIDVLATINEAEFAREMRTLMRGWGS